MFKHTKKELWLSLWSWKPKNWAYIENNSSGAENGQQLETNCEIRCALTIAGYSLKEKYSYISRMLKCKQELKRLLLSKIFTALLYGWYCLSCILGVGFTWLITCKWQYSILLNHTFHVIIVDIYLKIYEFLFICSGETVLFDWWVTYSCCRLLTDIYVVVES